MQDSRKYKQINWVDGMKITKNHFIGLENYFISRIQALRSTMIDRYNYGLISTEDSVERPINFKVEINNQHLNVKLINCQALSPGGYWIDISDESDEAKGNIKPDIETSFELKDIHEGEYFLIISVKPHERVPVGRVSTAEDPLRFPFVLPEFKLHLSNVEDKVLTSLSSNSLVIGKISYKDNKTEIDYEYIPPCSSIRSHPLLINYYTFLSQSLQTLENDLIELITEINSRESSNILTVTILYLSEKLLLYLSVHSNEYRWYLKNKPPIFLVDWVVTIAKIIKNAHETRTAEEKEKLLNYFHEHFDINPSRFKQLLDHTLAIDYDHNNINQSLEKANDFLGVISPLFSELKKMEFILGGKRKTRKIDIVIH